MPGYPTKKLLFGGPETRTEAGIFATFILALVPAGHCRPLDQGGVVCLLFLFVLLLARSEVDSRYRDGHGGRRRSQRRQALAAEVGRRRRETKSRGGNAGKATAEEGSGCSGEAPVSIRDCRCRRGHRRHIGDEAGREYGRKRGDRKSCMSVIV
jgi:hypothetical protein